jgi:hypothetical protein
MRAGNVVDVEIDLITTADGANVDALLKAVQMWQTQSTKDWRLQLRMRSPA